VVTAHDSVYSIIFSISAALAGLSSPYGPSAPALARPSTLTCYVHNQQAISELLQHRSLEVCLQRLPKCRTGYTPRKRGSAEPFTSPPSKRANLTTPNSDVTAAKQAWRVKMNNAPQALIKPPPRSTNNSHQQQAATPTSHLTELQPTRRRGRQSVTPNVQSPLSITPVTNAFSSQSPSPYTNTPSPLGMDPARGSGKRRRGSMNQTNMNAPPSANSPQLRGPVGQPGGSNVASARMGAGDSRAAVYLEAGAFSVGPFKGAVPQYSLLVCYKS